MLICDEYIALRAILTGRPAELPPTEPLGVTTAAWWRILRPAHGVIHARATGTTQAVAGTLSRVMQELSDDEINGIRQPDPRVLQVFDSRRILDTAAALGTNHRGGMLQLETVAAAIIHGGSIWYGRAQNLSPVTSSIAKDLGIAIHVLTPGQ